jgi:DNA-binding transcriptional regulator YhcF (GntR family)
LISLNYRDPRPIYEQLEEKLRRLILSGAIIAVGAVLNYFVKRGRR